MCNSNTFLLRNSLQHTDGHSVSDRVAMLLTTEPKKCKVNTQTNNLTLREGEDNELYITIVLSSILFSYLSSMGTFIDF